MYVRIGQRPTDQGLAGSIDPRLPFWIAAGLGLANALYGWLILPESLPKESRMAFSWRRANPFGALKRLESYEGGDQVRNFLTR